MKKGKYEKSRGLTVRGIEYSVYRMSTAQKILCSSVGATAGISAYCIFFGAGMPAVLSGAAGGTAGIYFGRKYFREKRMKELTAQFRDFLESLSSSLSSGLNVTGAVEAAKGDMRQLYGEKAFMTIEADRMADGMRNNMNIEEMLSDFACRSGQRDIRTFSETFSVCNRTGGNMREVIGATTRILSEKMQTDREIDVIASKGRSELTIMTVMPFIIIPMLRTLGDSGISGTNAVTVAVRVFGALLIGLSVFAGRKITDIRT